MTFTRTNNSLSPSGVLWEVCENFCHHGYLTMLDLLRIFDEAILRWMSRDSVVSKIGDTIENTLIKKMHLDGDGRTLV